MGAEDGGFLGWKNWKIPTTSRFEARSKPDEKVGLYFFGLEHILYISFVSSLKRVDSKVQLV